MNGNTSSVTSEINSLSIVGNGLTDYSLIIAVGCIVMFVLLLLRPFRAHLFVDKDVFAFSDGILWQKRFPTKNIAHFVKYDADHYAVIDADARMIRITCMFENLDDFFHEMDILGFTPMDRYQKRRF
ncbi:hypothetical protein LQZ18_17795 [Lachnospiraceae bacterium ZAX-1]